MTVNTRGRKPAQSTGEKMTAAAKVANKNTQQKGKNKAGRPPLQPISTQTSTPPSNRATGTDPSNASLSSADIEARFACLQEQLAESIARNNELEAQQAARVAPDPINPEDPTHGTAHSDNEPDESIPKPRGRYYIKSAMELEDDPNHYWNLVTLIHDCAKAAQLPLHVMWKNINYDKKKQICEAARSNPEGAYLRRFTNNWAAYLLLQQYHKNARSNKMNRGNTNTSLGRRILNRDSRITPVDGPQPRRRGARSSEDDEDQEEEAPEEDEGAGSDDGTAGTTPGEAAA